MISWRSFETRVKVRSGTFPDTVTITTGGSERARFDSSGRVGLNGITPGNYYQYYDDLVIGGQMKDGAGICPATGEGPLKINGSGMLEGPVVTGQPTHFPSPFGGLNIGPLVNSDSPPAFTPGALPLGLSNPYSAVVSPNLGVMGNLDVNFRIQAGGILAGAIVHDFTGNYLAAKKDFDIPHPTKDDWRLRHVAPEAPTADVYIRGRVTNKKEIFHHHC